MLKDHTDLFTANLPDLLHLHFRDQLSVQVDLAFCRLDQAVYQPKQSGFSTPRKTYNDEDFSLIHLEIRIIDPDCSPGLFLDLCLALAITTHIQGLFAPPPEDFRKVLYPDYRFSILAVSFRGSLLP